MYSRHTDVSSDEEDSDSLDLSSDEELSSDEAISSEEISSDTSAVSRRGWKLIFETGASSTVTSCLTGANPMPDLRWYAILL